MRTILFTHTKKQCGVYQFGEDIYTAINLSKDYNFVKQECESLKELENSISVNNPIAIIYNYHPAVMPWLCSSHKKGFKNNIATINCPQIGIIHEITQEIADNATAHRNEILKKDPQKKLNSLFDFYIAADPTLLLKNPYVYKTGRLVPSFINKNLVSNTTIPVIGSFGFGTPNKGFDDLILKVQDEFDQAQIKINIPFAEFGDKDGSNAKKIAEDCKGLIKKAGIQLEVTHEFWQEKELLSFLAGNDLNVFLYQDKEGRGISSALDNALAVQRPIAVSNCPMFRHVLNIIPSICVENSSLKDILSNGFDALCETAANWDSKNMLWEYERILDSVLNKSQSIIYPKTGFLNDFKNYFKKKKPMHNDSFSWLRDTESATKDNLQIDRNLLYTPVFEVENGIKLNRILDDTARQLYAPTIDLLLKALPRTMDKKIARANVQQAFVFDTVYRSLNNYNNPKLLCVGSYEDTASMLLIKMGFTIEEIDPMLNYFLQEYYTKPSTKKGTYDIIFSTSVIEHDPDDKSFLECIEGLLTPGGLAVITCDYKDGWVLGEPKPEVDSRFYTKKDMEERMLSYIPQCELVDIGDWDCPNPDFFYLDTYQYTFATFVFRKKK
jgi:glycosyltransferase involved in cell wall biosynthesis/SAM-dependent methyltransferase